jgi:hypothetical protein
LVAYVRLCARAWARLPRQSYAVLAGLALFPSFLCTMPRGESGLLPSRRTCCASRASDAHRWRRRAATKGKGWAAEPGRGRCTCDARHFRNDGTARPPTHVPLAAVRCTRVKYPAAPCSTCRCAQLLSIAARRSCRAALLGHGCRFTCRRCAQTDTRARKNSRMRTHGSTQALTHGSTHAHTHAQSWQE